MSAHQTADGPISILAYIDEDDKSVYPLDTVGVCGPRIGLGPAYQKLCDFGHGSIVMMAADDIVFTTQGWDTRVKEAMPKDLIGVVSCNELPVGHREHGHPFIGRRFIEEMGYICHPKLNHSCVDTWVREVAEGIGRFFYLDDVITEHVHPKYGKGKLDDTYNSNTREIKKKDGDFYKNSQSERQKIIKRLSECLDG